MRTLNPLDIRQNFRATTDNIAEREPSYAKALSRAMQVSNYANVGFPAFRSGRGTQTDTERSTALPRQLRQKLEGHLTRRKVFGIRLRRPDRQWRKRVQGVVPSARVRKGFPTANGATTILQ